MTVLLLKTINHAVIIMLILNLKSNCKPWHNSFVIKTYDSMTYEKTVLLLKTLNHEVIILLLKSNYEL